MICLRRLFEDSFFIENTSHISLIIIFISFEQTSIDFIVKVIFEEEVKKKTSLIIIINFLKT